MATALRLASGAVAVLLLAGCGGGVDVEPSTPSAAERPACAELVRALPSRVADESQREVDSAYAAAWGDPPIVLRCGVDRPDGFDKFSTCQRANGIDWFVPEATISDQARDVVMTTVGRRPAVEVVVPARYRPPVPAMVDLTPALKAHTERVSNCR